MSGPLLDRIDIHVEVPRVEYEKLTNDRLGEPSAHIRARIEKAREVQRQRFEGAVGGANGNVRLLCNADTPALAQSPKQRGAGQRRCKCGSRCGPITDR